MPNRGSPLALQQINVVVRDMQRSLAFYRLLGVSIEDTRPDWTEWAPHHANGTKKHKAGGSDNGIPTVAEITKKINEAARNATLSGAIPSTVAGKAAYTVRVAPKHDGGLLGAAEVAWDSIHGVPLRAAVYAQGSTAPVLALTVTDISYGSVSSGDVDVSPPAGAKVVDLGTGPNADHRGSGLKVTVLAHQAVRAAEMARKSREPDEGSAAEIARLPTPGVPQREKYERLRQAWLTAQRDCEAAEQQKAAAAPPQQYEVKKPPMPALRRLSGLGCGFARAFL